ncbi:hypothetical protein GTY75_09235 [Streptomyces sp. SID8381]|uniref:hypothetical protein n=1 Tax=unclassified Streptomyces TaxID=2593676 RepID=UPI000377808F|nr:MULTISPECIES: hypothetical protein [unclassified Streptomyces]MYX26850.1 hypothetical protein [Streptomyces sp. SID8381]
MLNSRRRPLALVGALILACSLTLLGATAEESAHRAETRADSWWGLVELRPEGDQPSGPIPGAAPGPAAAPADSAWG